MWALQKQLGDCLQAAGSRFGTGIGIMGVAGALVMVAPLSAQVHNIGGMPAARMEQDRLHALAEERQKKMLDDADKLLQMAQQLKTSVDKTNKDTLSVDVIREAERIEKLARQVRETMRQ